jgi:hypothetical protein
MLWVGKSTSFTNLEKRIYLYFYGKTLQYDSTKDLSHIMLYYADIASDFESSLGAQKKDVFKSIDSLKKKKLLRLTTVNNKKIFVLTFNGPVDML